MEILICTGLYHPDIGGPATYSKMLADELPKNNIEVEVLKFGTVRYLPKIIRHINYFFKILEKSFRKDIIFAQDPVSVGLPSVLAAKILGKKFALKIVGDYAWEQLQNKKFLAGQAKTKYQKFTDLEEFQRHKYDFMTELKKKIERWVAKKADKVIVPSEYLKKIVLIWGVKRDKISLIYNTFEAPDVKISREEARKKLNLSGTTLISVGRLVPWKGFSTLIDIMPGIIKEIPELKLMIIGSGPLYKNLKSQISNLKVNENVFLIDQVSHEELLVYFIGGDIFVLNSGYEGFSHVLLEAMATGIPVITTSVGGNREIINDYIDGILIDYNNYIELRKSVLDLCRNIHLREKMKINAKEKVKEFNKEKMIKKTIEVLL